MKKLIKMILWGLALCATQSAEAAPYRIAWTHYVGWEPWGYMQQSGILARWGQKYGVELETVLLNDYADSITQYSDGRFQACAMTNMDALAGPAAAGVDSTALIIGDYSNGNDGIVLKRGGSVKDLYGRKVSLVLGTVSHYLLGRALALNGMSERDVRLMNVADAQIPASFAADDNGAAVTWNPLLEQARKAPGAVMVFDSSRIPGEIMDLLVVRSSTPEPVRKAIAGAWFETIALIKANDPAAIAAMAAPAGGSEAEFRSQLKTTALFYDAKKVAAFADSSAIRTIMQNVRRFSFERGLLGNNVKSMDAIGIALGDGSMLGDPNKIRLRFGGEAMRSAAKP